MSLAVAEALSPNKPNQTTHTWTGCGCVCVCVGGGGGVKGGGGLICSYGLPSLPFIFWEPTRIPNVDTRWSL